MLLRFSIEKGISRAKSLCSDTQKNSYTLRFKVGTFKKIILTLQYYTDHNEIIIHFLDSQNDISHKKWYG